MPLRAALARAFAALARRHAARVAEAHLATLPDHLLRDIGLGRDAIPAAVRGLGPDDASAPPPIRATPVRKKLHT